MRGSGTRGAWIPCFATPAPGRPIQVSFSETFFRYMGFGKPAPDFDWLIFDVETDFGKLQAVRATPNATDPDLSRFKARGGKIVSYFGWADPLVRWVERGQAPATLPASRVVDGKTLRTRPLCPHPRVARYTGTGSTEDAANFACATP